MYGRCGDDFLQGGEEFDSMTGGETVLSAPEVCSDRDTMRGAGGNDRMSGGYGDDMMSGEAGNDDVSGGRGNDRLYGGPGEDVLGYDIAPPESEAGDDYVDAVDGERDTINCGDGSDTVDADVVDTVGPTCETVNRQ